jgi:biotin carboxyl carrier protein
METEIRINNRIANIELIERVGNNAKVRIDNKIYEIDIEKIGTKIYSVLYLGKSHTFDISDDCDCKQFETNSLYQWFDIKILDSQAKFLENKNKASIKDQSNIISTPMPGKIVKIPVKQGDKLNEGDTIIVVEAMKMQSEYKVNQNKTIKEILVKEGDTVVGNQTLIILE